MGLTCLAVFSNSKLKTDNKRRAIRAFYDNNDYYPRQANFNPSNINPEKIEFYLLNSRSPLTPGKNLVVKGVNSSQNLNQKVT